MKTKAAVPHVGHAAVSKPPLINANSILRPLPSRVPCPEVPRLCIVFIVIFKIFAKVRFFDLFLRKIIADEKNL